MGGRRVRLETIPGNVPNPANFPSGCKFHTRCPRTRELAEQNAGATVEIISAGETARVLKRCTIEEPLAKELMPNHWAACHQTEGYETAPLTRPSLNHKRSVVAEGTDVTADIRAASPASGANPAEVKA